MTREELLHLAKDVGAGYIEPPCGDFLTFDVDSDQLERFAARVAAAAFRDGYEKGKAGFMEAVALEREECAKVCEAEASIEGIAQRCAAAIRARRDRAKSV